MKLSPQLLVADSRGRIFAHPRLKIAGREGHEFVRIRPGDLIPLPEGSELFFLPGRSPVGYNETTGEFETVDRGPDKAPLRACAAFAAPAHTLTHLAAYATQPGAPRLPMFAYGAAGVLRGKTYVAALRVDEDLRQEPAGFDRRRISEGAKRLLKKWPRNRLVRHLASCALTYGCPAARNLCLGRYEAPLPTAQACNAACVGCLSKQAPHSGFSCTQPRIRFTPTAEEIIQIAAPHLQNAVNPVVSFGQGCEGEPLTNPRLLERAIRGMRAATGRGTINLNTNGSRPREMKALASAGLDAVRVSLNSAQKPWYEAYARPRGFGFGDVVRTIVSAPRLGIRTAVNYFVFPGVTDREREVEALLRLLKKSSLHMIQWRNLNLDPELYLDTLKDASGAGRILGVKKVMAIVRRAFPAVRFGYFNPDWE